MKTKYYLIGIGGISMSAIALYLLKKGLEVEGSDIADNPQTEALKKKGIKIHIGHQRENITKDISLVVYSSAITRDSQGYIEIKEAQELGIRTVKRSDFLGELLAGQTLITVAGTHGKSTIAAMVAKVLIDSGLKPTVFLGSNFSEFGGRNIFFGEDKLVVLEACEYDGSFLSFKPQIAVISNIEAEHLDYFKGGLREIIKSFCQYIQRVKKAGYIVYWDKDKNINKAIELAKREDITYINYAQDINDDIVSKLKLKIPGRFNIDNALAAFNVSKIFKLSDSKIIKALNEFSGVSRRQELKYQDKDILIFDDYAHHPTEIKVTLQAFKKHYPKRRLIVVFQPHQYSRTKLLFDDFLESFKDAELLLLTKVFEVAGREEKRELGSAELVKKIKKPPALYLPTISQAVEYLYKNLKKGDIVITMGAGNIYEAAERLIEKIKSQKSKWKNET